MKVENVAGCDSEGTGFFVTVSYGCRNNTIERLRGEQQGGAVIWGHARHSPSLL